MTSDGSDQPTVHAFGGWRFDESTGDLFDGTNTIRLEPKVARLLDYFLTHQDTLLTRDELMAAVWDDRVVSDDAINRCISILRQKLTPDDRNAYIETVVRRGFISHFPAPLEKPAPTKDLAPTGDSAPTPLATNLDGPTPPGNAAERDRRSAGQPPSHGRTWVLGALAGVAALFIFATVRILSDTASPLRDAQASGPPMVAVLPFISASLSGESEFFADGVHDDLLTQLAQLESMRVISRTSVSEYRNSERNIRDIGRALGADAILEGGVQHVGDQIRINVQLIDARSDVHLWAQQYDRELTPTNIFGIQSDIARSIAAALNSTLSQQDAAQLNVLPTENMAAYRAYHEAMELREVVTIAAPAYIENLERAVALDPDFIRAWAELAGAISFANIRQHEPTEILRLENILERIRAVAPESSEYLVAQSYYTYYILKDYDRAYELISRARTLRPSDIQILELQSWIQRRQGDIAGSIASIRQGQTLDPRSPYWTTRLANNLALAHRYDEALHEIESARVDSYGLAWLRSMLRMRDHRDPGLLLEEMTTLQREYGADAAPFDLWEAHIAARDYEGAAAQLDAFQAGELPAVSWKFIGVPDIDLARVITGWLSHGRAQMDTFGAEGRTKLEAGRDTAIDGRSADLYLATAVIMATEGHPEKTQRLVRAWRREANHDLAALANHRHFACRALGMAAAVPAAVECLRSALAEPSMAMPFIEPILPYYDPIRDDPRFVALLVEIDGG